MIFGWSSGFYIRVILSFSKSVFTLVCFTLLQYLIFDMFIVVCVCMCVCVRARARWCWRGFRFH